MPENSKVHHVYEALLSKGFNKASAAKIAQKKTGEALATGKPPKHPEVEKNDAPMVAGADQPGLVKKPEQHDEQGHRMTQKTIISYAPVEKDCMLNKNCME